MPTNLLKIFKKRVTGFFKFRFYINNSVIIKIKVNFPLIYNNFNFEYYTML